MARKFTDEMVLDTLQLQPNTIKGIADIFSCSKPTIENLMKKLTEEKLVTRTDITPNGKQRLYLYHLIDDEVIIFE